MRTVFKIIFILMLVQGGFQHLQQKTTQKQRKELYRTIKKDLKKSSQDINEAINRGVKLYKEAK